MPLAQRSGRGILNGLAIASGSAYCVGAGVARRSAPRLQLPDRDAQRAAHGNSGLAIGLKFERELRVEVMSNVASPQTVFWASYRIDSETRARRLSAPRRSNGSSSTASRMPSGLQGRLEF